MTVMKMVRRVVSICLVAMLVLTMLLGMIPRASAADITAGNFSEVTISNQYGDVSFVRRDDVVTLEFNIVISDETDQIPFTKDKWYECGSSQFSLGTTWKNPSGKKMELQMLEKKDKQKIARIILTDVKYNSKDYNPTLRIYSSSGDLAFTSTSGSADTFSIKEIAGIFPETYFKPSSVSTPSGGDNDDTIPSPEIVIESTRAYAKGNAVLTEITKDTAAFDIEVVYSDYGLLGYEEDIDTDILEVYAVSSGGFVLNSNRGSLYKLSSNSKTGAPRFMIRFSGVTYNGGTSSVGFRVNYDYFGTVVSGTGTADLSNIATAEKDEETPVPPATPHIIVSEYSYGEEQIIAGDEVLLNITYQNTSKELALENIVVTVTPKSEHTTIASASNTVYVALLTAGGSLSYPVSLKTMAAATGNQGIDVSFKYEYIVTVNSKTKERKHGEDSVSISIPVTQVDRFKADPITEVSEYIQTGQTFNVTISFVNEGKTPIYNISARARGLSMDIISSVSRVEGALMASANNSLDLDVIANASGDLMGEVVLTYEDENMHQKEIVMPFSAFVQEPYVPEKPWDPGMTDPGMEQPEPGVDTLTMILSIIGGLMVAAPIARYVSKRVKAKNSEEFDEDF